MVYSGNTFNISNLEVIQGYLEAYGFFKVDAVDKVFLRPGEYVYYYWLSGSAGRAFASVVPTANGRRFNVWVYFKDGEKRHHEFYIPF